MISLRAVMVKSFSHFLSLRLELLTLMLLREINLRPLICQFHDTKGAHLGLTASICSVSHRSPVSSGVFGGACVGCSACGIARGLSSTCAGKFRRRPSCVILFPFVFVNFPPKRLFNAPRESSPYTVSAIARTLQILRLIFLPNFP